MLDKADEEALSADQSLQVLEALTPLNRASTMLARTLQAAWQIIREQPSIDEHLPDAKCFLAHRDEAEALSRDFELLAIDAKIGLDYHVARNAERQAREAERQANAQHKLNVLAAMTFPLVMLGGLFGMNLHSGLESAGPWLFTAVLIGGVLIGVWLKTWVTRG